MFMGIDNQNKFPFTISVNYSDTDRQIQRYGRGTPMKQTFTAQGDLHRIRMLNPNFVAFIVSDISVFIQNDEHD